MASDRYSPGKREVNQKENEEQVVDENKETEDEENEDEEQVNPKLTDEVVLFYMELHPQVLSDIRRVCGDIIVLSL